ncbi:MAG: stage II sporulation protein M [Candidatus Paceibacterota bacterium]|jgi:stage II sporulation protein M
MIKTIFKEIKTPFLFLSLLFVLSLWLGYSSAGTHPKEAGDLFVRFSQSFSALKNINIMAMFLFIFVNNAVKAFAVMAFGAFFGIIPLLFVSVNGLLIGLVSSVIIQKHGASYLFAGTIPHGVLELPAALIAASYGLQLGKRYYRKLKYREPFKPYFLRTTEKMVRYVLPLLALASFVETFITMAILRSL